jgi:hypothetical protein
VVGIDPGPLTLRELALMAEGRSRLEWAQTSQLLAMLFNTHRDPKTPAVKPDAFNPYVPGPAKPPAMSMKAMGGILKGALGHVRQ